MGAGFWVGFANAMKEDRLIREDREEKDRLLQEERAWREGEADKQRKFEMDKFYKEMNARRQEAIAKLNYEAGLAGGGVSKGGTFHHQVLGLGLPRLLHFRSCGQP